jgi:hypothetical protein
MTISNIVAELRAERDRIDQAIAALEGMGGARNGRRSRRGRRHMSAAARRKISQMMKKRWAERKRKSA